MSPAGGEWRAPDVTWRRLRGVALEREEKRNLDGCPLPSSSPPGRLINLQVRFAQPLTWFGPVWAALCGALASGRMAFDVTHVLSLLMALFLIDPALGTIWELALNTDWSSPFRKPVPVENLMLCMLPYTVPNSPSHRLFHWVGRVMSWCRRAFWSHIGPALFNLVLVTGLALILAASLGRWIFFLILVALFLVALAFSISRQRGAKPLWIKALLDMGLAWGIGHIVFEPITWPVFLLGALYTAVYWAYLSLQQNRGEAIMVCFNIPQMAIVTLLIVLNQPLAAGTVGLLILPQLSLQPFLREGGTGRWYLRRTQPFLIISMLVAALAVG